MTNGNYFNAQAISCQDLACDWSKNNEHSRHILGVHGLGSLTAVWLDMTRKASWANYRFELSCNEFSWSADLEQLQILTTRSTNRDNLKLFRFLSSCYHFVSPSDRGKHSKTFYTRSIEDVSKRALTGKKPNREHQTQLAFQGFATSRAAVWNH